MFNYIFIKISRLKTKIFRRPFPIYYPRGHECPPYACFKASNIGTKIHDGAQGKHIIGHNNYTPGKSTLNRNINPQELLDGIHLGVYPVVSKNNRNTIVVDFGKPIGIDGVSGLSTNFGTIHSGKKGVHIVPYNPSLIRKID